MALNHNNNCNGWINSLWQQSYSNRAGNSWGRPLRKQSIGGRQVHHLLLITQAHGQPQLAGQVAVAPVLLTAYGRMLQRGGGPSQLYQLRMSNVILPQPAESVQNHNNNMTGFKGVRCRHYGM